MAVYHKPTELTDEEQREIILEMTNNMDSDEKQISLKAGVISNNKELLDKIHSCYGKSEGWESDLAKELDISRSGVSIIVQEAGYHRHKLIKQVKLATFTASPYAKYIIKKKGLDVIEEH